jgi:sulfonate transport system substrate-binding protein
MSVTRRSLITGAALAGLSLPLLGCRDQQVRAQGTRAGARRKVRLTYPITSVAKARGVFEQTLRSDGIDVEWIGPFPNHAPTLSAVATNSADFSFGGSSTPAHQAILFGAKLTYVAWLETWPRTTSIIVLPGSTVRTVPDLVGKTVAVNRAGVAEFLLVAALEKYRVPRDQVKVIYLNPPDAAPAFASGQIDAWSIWAGPRDLAEVQYGARRIFEEGKELKQQVDFGTYLVREDYARDEADTIRKIIRAHQVELAWTNAHLAQAQALIRRVSKYPQVVVDRLIAERTNSRLGFIDDEGLAKLQAGADWLAAHKVISGRLKLADHSVRL